VYISFELLFSGLPRTDALCSTGAAEDDRAPTEERACIRSSGFCSTAAAENVLVSELTSNRSPQVDKSTLFCRSIGHYEDMLFVGMQEGSVYAVRY
jgi:hypothetical protein